MNASNETMVTGRLSGEHAKTTTAASTDSGDGRDIQPDTGAESQAGGGEPFPGGLHKGSAATTAGGQRTVGSGPGYAPASAMTRREPSGSTFSELQPLSVITIALLVVALLVAGAALWKVRDLGRQLDALDARFTEQETAFRTAINTLPAISALRDDLVRLKLRTGELDREREKLRLAVDESQQHLLDEFIIRIVAVERIAHKMSNSGQSPADPSPRTRRSASKPVAEKVEVKPAKRKSVTIPVAEKVAAKPEKRESVTTPVAEKVAVKSEKRQSAITPNPSRPAAAGPKPGIPTASKEQAPNSGPWVVNLLSASTRPEAERRLTDLSGQGINAEIHPAVVKDQTWYRIRVVGFATVEEARRFGKRISAQMGLKGVWIARR